MRSSRSARRPRQPGLRLGRDFALAMLLLTLGVALPFASGVAQTRALRRPAEARGPQPAPAPDVRPGAPAADATAPPEGAGQADGGPAPLATLPPAEPTAVPAAPPPAGPLAALASPAPILMYHYVRTVDAAADPLGYSLSVTPESFAAQMEWLAQNGYAGVRVDTLVRCMRGEPLCPPKPVGLSFDDGYADAYDAALPVLRRYGFTATFYIVSGFVGQPGYMGWDQLAALRDGGMEIGAHSVDHLNLTRLDQAEEARQIAQSKRDLEAALRLDITSFCYPSGDYDGLAIELVRSAGFASAVTTRWDDNYAEVLALPRRRVEGSTTLDQFSWIVTS